MNIACGIINLNDFVCPDTVLHYVIDGRFFANYANEEIKDADVAAQMTFRANGALQTLCIKLQGAVRVVCDRCLDEFDCPICYEGNVQICRKRDKNLLPSNSDDEVILLEEGSTEIDLSQYLYESVCLSLPLQRLHPLNGCNPQMMAKLQEMNFNF